MVYGFLGKLLYVTAGVRTIQKADILGLTGPEREGYLRSAGGVSVMAGVLASIVYVALAGLTILAITTGSGLAR